MAHTDPPDLERLAVDLRLAIGRIARTLRRAHRSGELTLSQASVLARLVREGPTSPGALAEEEAVSPQALGTTLASLEERRLVSRHADAADGRRVLMSVTDAGRELVDDRRSESVQLISRALADGFTVAELERICEVLPLLDQLAERL
jgi:DNA-binding MarR family transcriptional regulator